MTKGKLKVQLKEVHGLSLKKFLLDNDYHSNHLSRYKENQEIPVIVSVIYENLTLKKEIYDQQLELQAVHNLNQSLYEMNLKNTIIEDPTFIPTVGSWCYFWNNNSEMVVIAKYSHSKMKEGTVQKIHFIKNSFYQKGFTKMAEYKDTLPKEFFVQHFHTKREN